MKEPCEGRGKGGAGEKNEGRQGIGIRGLKQPREGIGKGKTGGTKGGKVGGRGPQGQPPVSSLV